MRRGHPGIGSWRGENSRHFRSRGSGGPHFRPVIPFAPVDSPSFPPPVQRYRGPRPYNVRPIHSDDSGPSDHERQYRGPSHPNNQSRPQDRGLHDNRERQIFSLMQMRVQESNQGGSFNKSSYFEGNNYNTNNMGDVDHRQQNFPHQTWINPAYERRHYHNDKSPHKTPKHHGTGDALLPQPDYTGHRPPSSDHYSGTSGPNNNNNPYSRSVDDTVDIVRKRLMNRDSQDHPDPTVDQREMDTDLRKNVVEINQDTSQEQPAKKRVQKQIKSNCNTIKNKIVHQLFKMDKGKIHKLMDNPNSSSKFEYAISSLITESQNSLNRHMRSVAEKSLTTNTSSDFIHDDNNTIYEDTFMRQMQGVLDPQDTVLLEDIKPLVLAELSKVLCLDNFDRSEGIDDHARYPKDEYNTYYNEPGVEYPHNSFYEHVPETNHDSEVITGDLYEDRKYDFHHQTPFGETPQLFERRPAKKIDFKVERSRSRSTEKWQPRRSIDNDSIHNKSNEDIVKESIEPRPLFDGNCDQLSDDDDPFADLDNQYHVAVDHNFIEQEDGDISSFSGNHDASQSPPAVDRKDIGLSLPVPEVPSNNITTDIDTQLQSIAKSPLKLFSKLTKLNENSSNTVKVKQEIKENVAAIKDTLLLKSATENEKMKQGPIPTKKPDGEPVKPANNSDKHNSRKRSVDSKPSHRKEKRKKSSHSECHEAATSIFNMFYDNKAAAKDNKTVDITDKAYSDKYVKRKEPPKKSKEKVPDPPTTDTHLKQNSNTSHSITSPKDTSGSSIGDQTPSKIDKVKLTAIDIFSGSTKAKKANPHVHRNTSTPLDTAKSPDDNKTKPVIPTLQAFARKVTKRHMGTQVIRKIRNRECQTIILKMSDIGTQTEAIKFEKNQRMSADPLERMKEIDMEIQMLLQEKFKLYNSMESKSKSTIGSGSTMGTLGMAVLNVPIENDKDENEDNLADSIADDFTNLPVEELEQIAMETIRAKKVSSPAIEKRGRARKISDQSRKNSESPTAQKKKPKTPNISLLEQIITDDRPIEEIISLDKLEKTPERSKKKSSSRSSKKKSSKKHKSKPFVLDLKQYNLKKCSVVIQRLDIDKYLKVRADSLKIKINLKSICIQDNHQKTEIKIDSTESFEHITGNSSSPIPEPESSFDYPERPSPEPSVEEAASDIQIDMMEVCEDIVIGDEVKTAMDVNDRVPISEEIILDNSQSSAENFAPENAEEECKTYDYSTDDLLKRDAITVSGNADAVLAVECIDNSFIAACLDGNVYHFSTDGQLLSTLRGSNLAVTCLTILKEKYGTTVYTGSLDSRIRYYDLETGLEKGPECNVLSPIQTMDRAWDTVFVGTRTGFVLQFECKNNMLIPVSTVKFSEQSILALRAMKEGPRKVLLVAARSDNVTIKDAQTGLLLRTLEGPKMTVYSLLFEDGKVYCGTSSHQIHVFDYTSGAHVHAHEGGKGAVCLRATGGLVFAGCYDGCVYVYREGESRPLAQLRGPALMLLSLAIQGTKIIAGYKDRSLYIWKIPLAVLQEMIL